MLDSTRPIAVCYPRVMARNPQGKEEPYYCLGGINTSNNIAAGPDERLYILKRALFGIVSAVPVNDKTQQS